MGPPNTALWCALFRILRKLGRIEPGCPGGFLFMPRPLIHNCLEWSVLAAPLPPAGTRFGDRPHPVAYKNANSIEAGVLAAPSTYANDAAVLADFYDVFALALRVLFRADKWRALVRAQRAALRLFVEAHARRGGALAGLPAVALRPWEAGFAGSDAAEEAMNVWYAANFFRLRGYYFRNGPAIWILKPDTDGLEDEGEYPTHRDGAGVAVVGDGMPPFADVRDGITPCAHLADVMQGLYAGKYATAAAGRRAVLEMLAVTRVYYGSYTGDDGAILFPELTGAANDALRASFLGVWGQFEAAVGAAAGGAAAGGAAAGGAAAAAGGAAAAAAAAAPAADAAAAAYYDDSRLLAEWRREWQEAHGVCV